ncbi:hypothetical protein A2Z33_04485 [Candidatus Gottesmanbacteria bacterium RBG_16_52_11]|uniref:Uncharacterized protein n=1 Tax=Candidatus Gottesmanbacteria bacterium RBG_16_52_11 TaxID=1798374 RepID=A0A1F5YW25_9BACT|nr:MAG: hypothetical protein A2Z33_04485 [Candidatus Gottesmanbacteria bacterium RBG_16_52_11]
MDLENLRKRHPDGTVYIGETAEHNIDVLRRADGLPGICEDCTVLLIGSCLGRNVYVITDLTDRDHIPRYAYGEEKLMTADIDSLPTWNNLEIMLTAICNNHTLE